MPKKVDQYCSTSMCASGAGASLSTSTPLRSTAHKAGATPAHVAESFLTKLLQPQVLSF